MSPRPPGSLRPELNPDVILMLSTAGHVDHGKTMLVRLLIAVLVFSVFIFIIVFPFIGTAFLSPAYRERLMAVFAALPVAAAGSSSGSEIP